MGCWGTDILENDTSADVYGDFFDLYNQGEAPVEITKKLLLEYKHDIEESDTSPDVWLALALAQWETKSLDQKVRNSVTEIIESGTDIERWRILDASKEDLIDREKKLLKFLKKINKEKAKSKPRAKKKKRKEPIFQKGDCICFKMKNGNYGAAIVLEKDEITGNGSNLVLKTRINSSSKPTVSDCMNAEVLIPNHGNLADFGLKPSVTWFIPDRFEESKDKFELLGNGIVSKTYDPQAVVIGISYAGEWTDYIIGTTESQFEYEQTNDKPDKVVHVSEYTGKSKKWWEVWK